VPGAQDSFIQETYAQETDLAVTGSGKAVMRPEFQDFDTSSTHCCGWHRHRPMTVQSEDEAVGRPLGVSDPGK